MGKITPYYWNSEGNFFENCSRLINNAIDSATFHNKHLTEDRFEGYIDGAGYIPVTEAMAVEFYNDLVYKAKANNKPQMGTSEEVSKLMGITTAKANCYLLTCAYYGITERQGGFWVYE